MGSENITILVGTTKGAFLISGGDDRSGWQVTGPHCDGWPINHLVGDPATGTIWAGGGGEWHGAGVWRSEDGGESWEVSQLAEGPDGRLGGERPGLRRDDRLDRRGACPFGGELGAVWSLSHAHGGLYAGTKPAQPVQSRDGGATWERIEALTEHPSADSWKPGAAGLVLHTILSDPANPDKLWLGVSAAGVFATEDGGASWERRNRLSNAGAPRGIMITRRRRATARSGIACTT